MLLKLDIVNLSNGDNDLIRFRVIISKGAHLINTRLELLENLPNNFRLKEFISITQQSLNEWILIESSSQNSFN
jgi:hypothetical protein